MDVMQQPQGSKRVRSSFDWYAVGKGWIVTVGLWLGFTLALVVYWDATWGDKSSEQLGNVDFWPLVAAVSLIVALFAGLPLTLVLDRLLRRVQVPWLHVAMFFVFFALLTAGLLNWGAVHLEPDPFIAGAVLGACAAIGRAAALRRGRDFRRPTTWA